MPQAYIRTAKDIGPKHLRMSRSQAPKKIQSTCPHASKRAAKSGDKIRALPYDRMRIQHARWEKLPRPNSSYAKLLESYHRIFHTSIFVLNFPIKFLFHALQ